jgi:hypothetical protein
MAVDYSRFYLVGGRVTGFQLCCLDCDDNDLVPWEDDDSGALDLGQMKRAAEGHIQARHPDLWPGHPMIGQRLTSSDPEPPEGSLVVDDCGILWENDGHRPCCWIRPDLDVHDPETWTKIAGNYGPATVKRWGDEGV